jgi:hypothetical protein
MYDIAQHLGLEGGDHGEHVDVDHDAEPHRFRFANGDRQESSCQINLRPIDGPCEGRELEFHVTRDAGEKLNTTPPLVPINWARKHRVIVDYEKDQMVYKDNPTQIYKLPRNHCGLLMVPLTPQAVEMTRVAMDSSAYKLDQDLYVSVVENLDAEPRSTEAGAMTAAESTASSAVEDSLSRSQRKLRTK